MKAEPDHENTDCDRQHEESCNPLLKPDKDKPDKGYQKW
jgi:hypothetical protein